MVHLTMHPKCVYGVLPYICSIPIEGAIKRGEGEVSIEESDVVAKVSVLRQHECQRLMATCPR